MLAQTPFTEYDIRIMFKTLSRHRNKFFMLAALGIASAFCVAMLVARFWRMNNSHYGFMLWNLFLAWIPLLCSIIAFRFYERKVFSYVIFLLLAFSWLLFFPNSPYLVTDLIHLRSISSDIWWYDVIMFAAFAWTGFFMGFVSLQWMQDWIANLFGKVISWMFAIAALGLSAFGVYLGRFLRWNSWDIFFEPISLLSDVWQRIRHPLQYSPTMLFTVLLAGFLFCAYLMLVAYTQLRQEGVEVD